MLCETPAVLLEHTGRLVPTWAMAGRWLHPGTFGVHTKEHLSFSADLVSVLSLQPFPRLLLYACWYFCLFTPTPPPLTHTHPLVMGSIWSVFLKVTLTDASCCGADWYCRSVPENKAAGRRRTEKMNTSVQFFLLKERVHQQCFSDWSSCLPRSHF